MKLLIVEDEPKIARRLEHLLRDLLGDEIRQLDHRHTLADADEWLHDSSIDLLFLDLDLHGCDGFELLTRAVAGSFLTVVVSANTDRAITAFEHGVVDFVPKPFSRERLRQALDRARGVGSRQAIRFLACRSGGEIELVPLASVRFVRGAGNYSELHLDDGRSRLHDKNLERLERLLPQRFVRIHKSYLVSLDRLRRLHSLPGSRYQAELTTGERLPIGRSRIAELRKRFP